MGSASICRLWQEMLCSVKKTSHGLAKRSIESASCELKYQ